MAHSDYKYSNSKFRIIQDHCPRALGFYEEGTPRLTEVFSKGLHAHSIIELFADLDDEEFRNGINQYKVDQMALGEREEWLDEAANLVIHWRAKNGFPKAMVRELVVRQGDFGGTIDEIGSDVIEGEDGEIFTILVVRDYKTSWHDIDPMTPQLQAYAAMALDVYDKRKTIYGVRLEIANLRTGCVYSKLIDISSEEGIETLKEWKDSIDRRVAAIEKADLTQARPGAGCASCPYTGKCESGRELLESIADGMTDAESIASAFAFAKGAIKNIEALAREATKNETINGVGFHASSSKRFSEDMSAKVLDEWASGKEVNRDLVLGLFGAMGGIQSTQFKKFLKKKFPRDIASQEAFEANVSEIELKPKFGVKK